MVRGQGCGALPLPTSYVYYMHLVAACAACTPSQLRERECGWRGSTLTLSTELRVLSVPRAQGAQRRRRSAAQLGQAYSLEIICANAPFGIKVV